MLSWFKRNKDREPETPVEGASQDQALEEMPLSEILTPPDVRSDVDRPAWLAEETEDTPHPQLSASYLDVDLNRLRADRLKRGDSLSPASGSGSTRAEHGLVARAYTRLGDLKLGPIRMVYDNLGTLFVAALSLLGLGVATWAVMEFINNHMWNLIN